MSKIRLDVYLVASGQFESRAQARAAIEGGKVLVNGRPITKASFPVPDGANIEAEKLHPYVSRAALKLKDALNVFAVDVKNKICLDIGASTGGFVQVLLESGADHVTGVDVGTGQLHAIVRANPRVTSLEQTDARDLTSEDLRGSPEIITCDASFIGLAKVIETPLSLAAETCDLIALFKPQFEVGPRHVGKGGLVINDAAQRTALADFRVWLNSRHGFNICDVTDSPITGGDRNCEFLVHARKG